MSFSIFTALSAVRTYFQPAPTPSPERKLSRLFYGNQELHKAVETAPFVKQLRKSPDCKEYLGYLLRLHAGIRIAEKHWQKAEFEGKDTIDLTPFFRTRVLDQDIASFRKACKMRNVPMMEHVRHFDSLSKTNPKLLLAHLGLRYYAILHGGQDRAERLRKIWENTFSLNLYTFKKEGGALRNLSSAIDTFGKGLSQDEYQAFEKEMKLAWAFAGDCLNHDVRHLL